MAQSTSQFKTRMDIRTNTQSESLSNQSPRSAPRVSEASEVLSLLTTLDADMQSALTSVVSGLDTVLTAVHYNLTNSVNDFSCGGCDGSCSGCSAIVPDDIFLRADFSTVSTGLMTPYFGQV